uniref:Uncharacterized protein n=1 Tax=Anguilla anguilla TaxID=7936 RepID=A0A0E9UUH2_ANGAN
MNLKAEFIRTPFMKKI